MIKASYIPPTCGICLEELTCYLITTPCGHVFHLACMTEALSHSVSKCPQCRVKIRQSTMTELNYELSPVFETVSIPGLSEEETQNLLVLQKSTRKAHKEKESLSIELDEKTKELESAKGEIEKLMEENNQNQQEMKDLYAEKATLKKENYNLDMDKIRCQGLLKKNNDKLEKLEQKVKTLENMDKLMKEFSNNLSVVAWANDIRDRLTIEEQAEQFYVQIIAQANTISIVRQDNENLRKSIEVLRRREAENKLGTAKNDTLSLKVKII